MTNNLLGTWKLVSCKTFDINGVEQVDSFGDASGVLMYDDKGTMAAQLMRSSHKYFQPNNLLEASDFAYKNAFTNYLSYYGTYSINEKESIVTHKVLGALWPNMIGLEVSRHFVFQDENTIILSLVTPEVLVSVEPIMRYLTWRRVTKSLEE